MQSVFSKIKGATDYFKTGLEAGGWDIATIRAYKYEREKQEKRHTQYLRGELESTPTGRQCLNTLDESGYQICYDSLFSGFEGRSEYSHPGGLYAIASTINPEKKRITLSSNVGSYFHLLSLVNAACTVKQEQNGAGNSPEIMAVRKADALLTQLQFSKEQPVVAYEFYHHLGANMSDVYDIACDVEKLRYIYKTEEYAGRPESDIKDSARSACIDFFLNDVLGKKVPSAEIIADICRDFNGKSYYKSDNRFSRDGKKEMDSARKSKI